MLLALDVMFGGRVEMKLRGIVLLHRLSLVHGRQSEEYILTLEGPNLKSVPVVQLIYRHFLVKERRRGFESRTYNVLDLFLSRIG